MYITICKIDSRWKFALWLKELKLAFCDNLETWDGMGRGREVQEGGNMCIPMADSIFPIGSADKESACNTGDASLIPGSGRSPGEGNGSPLQSSCLKNLMGRGAWRATVYGVPKSLTRLSGLNLKQIWHLFNVDDGYTDTYGWFMLMYGRSQHNIVKQLSSS